MKHLNLNSTFVTYLGLFLLAVVAVGMVLCIAYSDTSNIVSFSIR